MLKHKIRTDARGKEDLYEVEVAKCSCSDKKIFSTVCGENGIVKAATRLSPDQQSVFYDNKKSALIVLALPIVLAIIGFS